MVFLWRFGTQDEEIVAHEGRQVPFVPWITNFFRETSFQGIPQLVRQPGIVKKLFWLAAIVACAYGLEWELEAFFTKFLSWTANTAVTIQAARSLPFPAVTICNNNPISSDFIMSKTGEYIDTSKSNSQKSLQTNTQQSQQQQQQQQQGNPPQSSGTQQAQSGNTPASSPTNNISPSMMTSSPGNSGGTATTFGPFNNSGGALPLPPGRRRKRQAPPMGQQQQQQGQQSGPTEGQQTPRSVSNSFGVMLKQQSMACSITYENRSTAGHQLCDMMLKTQFQGVDLSPQDAFNTWHWNTAYGNCFTFNSGFKQAESPVGKTTKDVWTIKTGGDGVDHAGVAKSTQPGDMYGLYLLLDADVHHYMLSTKQIGWRIIIHNQTEMPFPEEGGVFVAPGTSTRIGLSMKYVERLGVVSNYFYNAAYSDCVDKPELVIDDPMNAYSNMMEVAYSKSGCLKTCYQQNVMRHCDCFDMTYPSQGSAFNGLSRGRYLPCIYENITLWNCKLAVAQQFQSDKLPCDCPDTCKGYSYDTTISHLKWPNSMSEALATVCQEIYDVTVLRANSSDPTCNGSSYTIVEAKKTADGIPLSARPLLKCVQGEYGGSYTSDIEYADDLIGARYGEVYIYYKDFTYQSIVETQFLEFADLLAYLGGILGLFFGFTFLTLFEYIQLLVDLIILAFARLYCGRRNGVVDNSLKVGPERPTDSVQRSGDIKNELRLATPAVNTSQPPSYNNAAQRQQQSADYYNYLYHSSAVGMPDHFFSAGNSLGNHVGSTNGNAINNNNQ